MYNVEHHENALRKLYEHRVTLGAEPSIDWNQFVVDASSCSAETQAGIQEYVIFVNEGRYLEGLWEDLKINAWYALIAGEITFGD